MKFKADLLTFSLKFGERDDIFSKDVIPLEKEVLRFEATNLHKDDILKKGCHHWIACKIQSGFDHILFEIWGAGWHLLKRCHPFEGGIAEI